MRQLERRFVKNMAQCVLSKVAQAADIRKINENDIAFQMSSLNDRKMSCNF